MISIFKQFFLISPVLILSLSIVLNLLIIIFKRNFFLSFIVTFLSLFSSLFFFIFLIKNIILHSENEIYFKSINIIFIFLFFLGSMFTCIFSYIWLKSKSFNKEEFYLLLLISNIGGCVLFLSSNIFSYYIGIELLSFPLFGMMSYNSFKNFKNLESSFKYFILSSISSIFLLLGISLIYLSSRSLNYCSLKLISILSTFNDNQLFLFGLVLSCISLFIKLSVFPFYLWISNIYKEISCPVLMYFSNSVKILFFVVLLKLLFLFSYKNFFMFSKIIKFISICSIFVGSILALFQTNLKRLIGYSTIISSGYLCIILIFLHQNHKFNQLSKIYLLGYCLNSLVLFSSMILISFFFKDDNNHSFKNYEGFFWKSYILSISIIISLFSIVGLPFTIGFFGKFYILKLIIQENNFILGFIILFESVLSLYYYFNFIKIFFYKKKSYISKNLFIETFLYKFLKIFIFLFSLIIVFIGFFPICLDHLNYFIFKI
ncbi:NADH-quinone oxidoreductase subunit N [Buchnera aphidicola]|uniref:NADH-quinone oxidoreductase subunit N n=1 Tax=Buchnera aphidicola TaxID=9 RepID=UPI0031B8204C